MTYIFAERNFHLIFSLVRPYLAKNLENNSTNTVVSTKPSTVSEN